MSRAAARAMTVASWSLRKILQSEMMKQFRFLKIYEKTLLPNGAQKSSKDNLFG